MTEIRRNSLGDVLGPRPYDPRSYDEKQAPKVTTHIRTEAPGPDWSGLCGAEKPLSSITRRLYAAQQRGDIQSFNQAVTICPQCKELAQ